MRRLLAIGVAALLALPAVAFAHQGNPNFRSIITSVAPRESGLTLNVLNGDDRLELINEGKAPVVVYGYNDEPYARVLPDGTVQVNRNSPATYLNNDRYEVGIQVPKGVKTTVFDWKVPVRIGGNAGAIRGELFWVPKDNGGPPLGAIAGFAGIVLVGGALVVLTRRRRGDDGDEEAAEAW
jgi:hypothetical protein